MDISDEKNTRYKKKYKYLKRNIKTLLIENAALCDEVAKVQENIVIVKEERKLLLRKLLEYEHNLESNQTNLKNLPQAPVNGSKVKKRKSPEACGKTLPLS